MKTYLILIFALLSQIFTAQCNILGSESIKVGDSVQYSSDIVAKCLDCYSWKISSDEQMTITDNKEGQISIKALKQGTAKINLSVETENGSLSCEKNIEIKSIRNQPEKQCNVEITDFKDVKVDDNTMSFFPNVNSSKYTYQWKVTYADGSTKESTEKIPQFSNNTKDFIENATVKIFNTESLCALIITRTFSYHYWFPKVEKIEQRKYQQGSFNKTKDIQSTKTDISN
ncbi:hypothetical protein [Chryseobacterium sp.]|uniref:hypothetical protein n=1 Tax=Chryseobacterium sp. TaxID=1871047 RepID=UPI00289EC271|nr:hypothetical protein [Chryseobacterium sp.]